MHMIILHVWCLRKGPTRPNAEKIIIFISFFKYKRGRTPSHVICTYASNSTRRDCGSLGKSRRSGPHRTWVYLFSLNVYVWLNKTHCVNPGRWERTPLLPTRPLSRPFLLPGYLIFFSFSSIFSELLIVLGSTSLTSSIQLCKLDQISLNKISWNFYMVWFLPRV